MPVIDSPFQLHPRSGLDKKIHAISQPDGRAYALSALRASVM
jgi:hypothetical protein